MSPGSWMNLARKRREENFVGRAEQLKVFTENFASSEPAWMILAVTGEGGVGKSTLLERYARLAEETPINAHVVLCDDRYYTPVDVMGAVAEQLARVGIQSREFDERYRKYRQALQQIESDPSAPRGMVDAVTRGLTDFTIKSLRRTPGVGVALEYVDEKAVGEALAELAHYALNRWGNKDEVELVRQPEKILTPLFVELLNQAAGKKRLIVMLDVFERTAATLSEWLMALFKFEYGDLELGVSFILSGRDPLEQHWTELAGLMTHIRLEPFTPEETATYLSNRGITDAGLVRQIHEDTGGLPVLVELLAATNPQPGQPLPDISRDAVQRFLQWTPEEDKRRAALLAAIPRQFHQDILKVLLGEAGVPLFHWLTAQSYIRSMQERGWFYHDKVRMLMVRYQYHSAPQEAAACHAALADYFAGLQAQTGLEKGEACKSERWRRLELERLYHRLCAAPESAPACLRNAFLPAFFYQWRFADELLRVARQAAYDSRLNGLEDELTRLEALWTAYDQDDYSKVVSILNALERANHLDPSAEWALLCRRGDAYYWLDRHEQALQDFNRAIELDEKYAWAIARRATTHLLLGRYEQALQDFDRAIKLDEKYAWAIARRGETYRLLGRYEQALQDFDRAIALDENMDWAIASRGETYRLLGRYEQALQDFDRAIALDEKDAWAIRQRGITHRYLKNFDQALEDINRAIALKPEEYAYYYSRAETYRLLGRYAEAIADFTATLKDEKPGIATYVHRASAYLAIGDEHSARADLEKALSLECKDEGDHYSRAAALVLSGDMQGALAELELSFANLSCRIEAQTDDLLAPLRDLPEFQALLAKYEPPPADTCS